LVPRRGRNSLISLAPRPTVVWLNPPIQWTLESVSQELKRMGYEPITHLHLLPRVGTLVEVQTFVCFPVHFNAVVIYSAQGKQIPVYSGLRYWSVAARLLRSRVRMTVRSWTFVSCVCCVLSVRRRCDELIYRSGESHLVFVSVCVIQKLKK
jgi:hypothetical protein